MKSIITLALGLALPLTVWAAPKPNQDALTRLHQFRPHTSNEAFTFHEQLLAQRITRLQQTPFLSDDKKKELADTLTEEQQWLIAKRSELATATSIEAKQAIRSEIIEHIQAKRQEHEVVLAKEVPLPTQSPVIVAEQILDRFHTLAQAFNDANLNTSIEHYAATVTALEQALTDVQQDKTIEHIRTLRDAIAATRAAAQEVRNQIQSLVIEQ